MGSRHQSSIKIDMKFIALLSPLILATFVSAGEFTKFSKLKGYKSFTDIRAFVDGCDQDTPDWCMMGFWSLYECCYIKDPDRIVRGHLTMVTTHEPIFENGDMVCESVGLDRNGSKDPCIEQEFNINLPLEPNTPVQFNFAISASQWYLLPGSSHNGIHLRSYDGEDFLSFATEFSKS